MSTPLLPPERHLLAEALSIRLGTPGTRTALVGESGSGKSTLLETAVAQATRRDPALRVLFARGVAFAVSTPYLGLHELLVDEDLQATPLSAVHARSLESALGTGSASAPVSPGAVMMASHVLVRGLLDLGPVAIVVDEFDALDDETRQLVDYLGSRRYDPVRAPSILVTREADDTPGLAGAEVLVIPPLTPAGLHAIVRERLGQSRSSASVDTLWARSGGNPLWALELAARPGVAAPGDLGDALDSRIDAARTSSRRIGEAVAVLGTASAAEIGRFRGVGASDLSAAIDDDIVRERDGVIALAHPLLGPVLLARLDDSTVKGLHAAAAAVVRDPVARAGHLDRSLNSGPDGPLAAELSEATDAARTAGALSAAADLAERTIRRTAAGDPRESCRRIVLAEVRFAIGDFEGAVDAVEDLVFADLPVVELDRALPLLLTAAAAARGDAAARALLRAASFRTEDPVKRAIIDTYVAESGDAGEDASRLARRSLEVLRDAGSAPVTRHRAIGAQVIADLDAGLGLDDGLLTEAAALEPHLSLLAVNDSAAAQTGLYSHQIGDLDTSRRVLEDVRATALDAGEDVVGGVFALHLATVELYAGNRARADQWLREWEAVDPWPGSPPPSAVLPYGLRALRDGDDDVFQRLMDAPRGPGSEAMGDLARMALRGLHAGRREQWEASVAELLAARSLAVSLGIREPGRRHWIDFTLARGLAVLGRSADALDIAESLERLSNESRPLLRGAAERIRGLVALHDDDPRAALTHLRASAAHLLGAGFPTEQAQTHLDLARTYHTLRSRERALRAVNVAEDLARSSSDAQLRETSVFARSRIDAAPADDGLSVRERAIALAAARGASNREIAAANHISVRTVESQLSAAYRKLGVRSRTELVALLSAVGPDV